MRILAPILTGCDDQLAALRRWVALPGERATTALLISGEAGLGKLRLLREARAIAFAPFIDLLSRTEPGQLTARHKGRYTAPGRK